MTIEEQQPGEHSVVAAQPLQVRHITLDAVRGFAVMGILAMNIVAFAMPEVAYLSPSAYGGDTGLDLASWIVSTLFIDGKMRGLFSVLFGASMMLVIDRAVAKGESPTRVHYGRMIALLVFGLIHFFLIWDGDILFSYAAMGCIAYLFRKLRSRTLIWTSIVLYVFATLIMTLGMGYSLYDRSVALSPGATIEQVRDYQKDVAESPFRPAAVAAEIKLHRGSYTGIVMHKLREDASGPLTGAIIGLFETLPMMLLGMALLKNGFLTGEWDARRYWRIAYWTVPAGLAVTGIIMLVEWRNGFDELIMLNGILAWTGFPRLAITIGYAALLILLIRRFADGELMARVASAGRVAFSNYLGTSIIMTTVFYGYGLGLFGHVSRAGLWPFVFAAWAVMLLWSKPWLAHFRYGPLEWLWRSVARGSLQPMRR